MQSTRKMLAVGVALSATLALFAPSVHFRNHHSSADRYLVPLPNVCACLPVSRGAGCNWATALPDEQHLPDLRAPSQDSPSSPLKNPRGVRCVDFARDRGAEPRL